MSTYYRIICTQCRERADAAARGALYGAYGASESVLVPFIVEHAGHPVEIINENDDEFNDPAFEDWTVERLSELCNRFRPPMIPNGYKLAWSGSITPDDLLWIETEKKWVMPDSQQLGTQVIEQWAVARLLKNGVLPETK